MGPRLGRVEYVIDRTQFGFFTARFNGATLRTRGIPDIVSFAILERILLQWGHA